MTPAERAALQHLADHGGGLGTWLVALAVGMPTDATRRLLIRLERKGLVFRDRQRSAVNNTAWRLTEAGLDKLEAVVRADVAGCRCQGTGQYRTTVAKGLRYVATTLACTHCEPGRTSLRNIVKVRAHVIHWARQAQGGDQ